MATSTVDPVTLDLIENALKNARLEMDEVLRRSAMSSSIREQHDEFPMIANERGQMIVGQFGSYIPEVIDRFGGNVNKGDVIVLNDPYLCKGSISHTNDILVIVPIFHEDVLVGFASQFGHVLDMGGRAPGTQTADALSIWDEGLRIPPIKIHDQGELNETALALILNNTRTPDIVRSDLLGLIGACQRAEQRVMEMCGRFGRGTYMAACDALLERTRRAMVNLIHRYMPEEKSTCWDWVDDDGLGHGPCKLQLTVGRDGD
jgi:N-methylhydantoinase B